MNTDPLVQVRARGETSSTDYRSSLPDDEIRGRNDAAIAEAAQVLADARYERDMLAATCGTRAVAEAASYPGHRLGSVEAIQAAYEAMRQEARRRLASAADRGRA
jgi:hypothetical protein